MQATTISGYNYGNADVARSPVSTSELELLKKTVFFSEEDEKYLRLAGEVLSDQTNDVLDLWYGFVGSNQHLVKYFAPESGSPNADYLAAVRNRFGQWIMDLCNRKYDEEWLNYQHEIALRHHSSKKNKTDKVDAAPIIHFRYMTAFIYPITATIKSFLAKKGHDAETVDKMHQAWFKAVVLTVTLWCYPYVKDDQF